MWPCFLQWFLQFFKLGVQAGFTAREAHMSITKGYRLGQNLFQKTDVKVRGTAILPYARPALKITPSRDVQGKILFQTNDSFHACFPERQPPKKERR